MKTKESLCEKCVNKLHLKYLELPFKFDTRTGEQLNTEVQEHNEPCIYIHFRYGSTWEQMLIIECDKFKSK